jgi:hypothetical protein
MKTTLVSLRLDSKQRKIIDAWRKYFENAVMPGINVSDTIRVLITRAGLPPAEIP